MNAAYSDADYRELDAIAAKYIDDINIILKMPNDTIDARASILVAIQRFQRTEKALPLPPGVTWNHDYQRMSWDDISAQSNDALHYTSTWVVYTQNRPKLVEVNDLLRQLEETESVLFRARLIRALTRLPEFQRWSRTLTTNPRNAEIRVEFAHQLFCWGYMPQASLEYETALALGVRELKSRGLSHLLLASSLGISAVSREHLGTDLGHVIDYFETIDPRHITLRDRDYPKIPPVMQVIIAGATGYVENPDLDEAALMRFHVEESIKCLESHAKANPADLDSLMLLSDVHASLKNPADKGRVDALIRTAKALQRLSVQMASSKPQTKVAQGSSFEGRCLKILSGQGFIVSHTGKTHDGGIDIRATFTTPITSLQILVQCKDWQQPVGEPTVRGLYGLVFAEGVQKGVLITSGQFTDAAKRFAAGKPLELMDGTMLNQLERTPSQRTS